MIQADLLREVVPEQASRADTHLGRGFVALANRTSRRSFIGWVGRASLALMGGAYLSIWQTESAAASPCVTSGGQNPATTRFTCLCSEVGLGNSCPNCCGGFWVSCLTNVNDPASCWQQCPGGGRQFLKVRLWDCCNQCSGQDSTSRPGCWSGANDFCHQTGANGYCNEGGCCSGTGCSTWRVKCVVKSCTGNTCTACP